MAEHHEKWLKTQGVKIIGRRTLRRASNPGYMNWDHKQENSHIDWSEQFTTTNEDVYQVELDERTIGKFERFESTIKYALQYMDHQHGGQRFAAPSSDVLNYYIDNNERHLALLEENSMYRDAWKDFQTIRALLGETPHWP